MEIKNSTTISKKLFVSFQRFYSRLVKKSPVFDYIIEGLMAVVTVFLFVLSKKENSQMNMLLGFMLAAMLITLILMKTVFPLINYKKTFLKGMVLEYTFTDNALTIKLVSEKATSSETIKYTSFYKAYDAKDAIYIFIDKAQAFLVDKSAFSSKEDEKAVIAAIKNATQGNKKIYTKVK